MPDKLKDLKTLTTFIKNFFTKVVLKIQGKVEVENFPEVQRVEVTNSPETYSSVEVSNLVGLQKTVETALTEVVKAVKAVDTTTKSNKPEKAKEDLINALSGIQEQLAKEPIDNTPLITGKLDDIVKAVGKVDTEVDLQPVVNEIQTVLAGLDFFKSTLEGVVRFDEVKVRLPDKQIEKLSKGIGSAVVTQGGSGLSAQTTTVNLEGDSVDLDSDAGSDLHEGFAVVTPGSGGHNVVTSTTSGAVEALDVQVNNTVTLGQTNKANSLPVAIALDQFAAAPTAYNVAVSVVDTQYSQSLPANTRAFEFKSREGNDIRFAFAAGKVAGPTSPYFTASGGETKTFEFGDLTGQTLYVAVGSFDTPAGADVIEIIAWT